MQQISKIWDCPNGFGIMGILNITPDSFFDGGRYTDAWLDQGKKMHEEGSNIIDIGAESTRPGASPISAQDELNRLKNILPALRKALPEAVLSLDTRNSSTAAWGLAHGVQIINDVSGLRHDPGLLEILAEYKPGYVLMHSTGNPATMQRSPSYHSVGDCVKSFFEDNLERLSAAGLPDNRIVLDPGIGFGKTVSHNLELLQNIESFKSLGFPLLIGLSMKSMFGQLFGLSLEDRDCPTAVVSALLMKKGVQWHRVHQVAKVKMALSLASLL